MINLDNLTDDEINALYDKYYGHETVNNTQENSSFLSNLARQGYQGATLGFGPKILAAGAALGAKGAGLLGEKAVQDIPFSELYDAALTSEREKLQKGQEAYPISSFGAQIGASIPTGGALLKSAGLAEKGLKTAIKGGALLGGLEGIGRTNDLVDVGQTTSDALTNAAFGGVIPVGLAGAGGAIKMGAKFTSPIFEGVKQAVSNPFTSAQNRAINLLKRNLATEGENATDALQKLNDTGLDLIDIIDPRFKTRQDAVRFLQDKQTIKNIADTSLERLNQTSNNLQKEVSNMLASRKIDNEQAGDILGRNAKKIIDTQINARRMASTPLYEQGTKGNVKPNQIILKNLDDDEMRNLSLNPSLVGNANNLTAQDFLSSPIVKKIIEKARSQSEEFAKTEAGFIYKDIANPSYSNESLKVLNAADHVLTRMIGNPALAEQADVTALRLVKQGLHKLLDEANPTLKKAREMWSADSKEIKKLENSSIGKIATLYNMNKTDDLIKRSNDILLLSPKRITQIRTQNPTEFNELLRNSFENKLDTIVPESPKAFTKAIFGKDGGLSLKAALGDDAKIFDGIKKLTQVLDSVADRQKLTSNATAVSDDVLENTLQAASKGGISNLFIKPVLGLYRTLLSGESPEMRRIYTEYLFTPKGKELLKQFIKTDNKIKQGSIFQTILNDLAKLTSKMPKTTQIPANATAIGLANESPE